MDGSGPVEQNPGGGHDEPIAIIGVSCRFPGAADLAAFEALLLDGRDAVTEIPDGRWAKERYLHPARGHRGKTYTFAAGTLDSVGEFDAGFFGISPREAAQMDPQQRLLLELAHEAVEDAGLDGARLAGAPVGVYVGGSSWDYLTLHTGDPSIMDAYAMTGATLCSLANRVSYAFDLRGPSLTMDTACSSSLVALHQACEAIRAGQVPMALVGGVSLLLAPHSFVGFSAASMLSPLGRCHAFDARADGYVRSEGGAMIVLRPLREALAAGDTIRAVVRGTGVNSDGRTTGFSLPNKAAQADLLRAVYSRFEIDPGDLNYVEAHGTGTPAGDPIEAGALGEVLGRHRSAPLPIGSVKTNIGHLEAASGLAGLLKVVVALKHGVVPRSLHCETPNPAIPFEDLNLSLVADPLSLKKGRLLAGVNSFGFGGTNAHAVLESAWSSRPRHLFPVPGMAEGEPPLLISARSEPALRALATAWREKLDAGEVDAALVRGAAVSREQHTHRLVVAGRSNEAMAAALTDWLHGRGSHDLAAGTAVAGKVAFVFSGNGSQWAGMGVAALEHNARFRAALAEVDRTLQPMLGWSVQDRLAAADDAATHDTGVAQPLLFATQVATVGALREIGVFADFFMGHSVGEVAAAWAAGSLSLEQACRVIAARSQLQSRTAGNGRMGVLGMPLARAKQILAGSGLELAAFNASNAITVAGSPQALATLAERAVRERFAFSELDLDHAFHSAAMDPIEQPLLTQLADLAAPPCERGFLSTVSGGTLPKGARLDGDYWWRNVREPVQFAQAAAAAVAQGARIFVEIGPQPVLQAYLHDALRQVDATGRVLPTLTRRAPKGRDVIAVAAARCHVAGCDIRSAQMFAGPHRHHGLPAYPWQRELHWLGRTAESTDTATLPTEHPLLGARQDTGTEPAEWSSHLGPSLQVWLADHVVGGATVAPAAALIEMALAAARARHPKADAVELLDLEISRPLTFEADILREVRLKVSTVGSASRFEISSRPRLSDEAWILHASGRLGSASSAHPVRADAPAVVAGGRMEADELYARAARLGLQYGPLFQTVAAIDTAENEAHADVRLVAQPDGAPGMLLPPTLLDGAFQGLVALAVKLLPGGDGVLPWRFGRVRLLRAGGAVPVSARLHITRMGPRSVNADLVLLSDTGEIVAEALDCWFVRVALGVDASRDAHLFHTVQVASPDLRLAGIAGPMLPAALAAGSASGGDAPHESVLLADAFAAAAANEAVRSVLADLDASFTASSLVASGAVVAAARPLLHRLMQWLVADGFAEAVGDGWRLLDAEAPAADDILRTLVFDTPGAVADAALLAAAAEALPGQLQDGNVPWVAPPASLAEQFLHSSPAGEAANRALIDAVASIARAWPAGQPLRVLQVGAWRGTFSRALLRRLAGEGLTALHLDAVTDPADQPALARALTGFANAKAVAWPAGRVPAEPGQYDVVVGFCPLSLGGLLVEDLAALPQQAPGGSILLLEPAPTRTWSLLWPSAVDRLRDGAAWGAALGPDAERLPVDGSWPASLIALQAAELSAMPGGSQAHSSVVLVAAEQDALAQAIADAWGEPSAEIVRCSPTGLAALQAGEGFAAGDIAFVLDERTASIAAWLNHVARCAEAMPAGTRLTLLAHADAAEPLAAALAGLRRVMANESPDAACRLVQLDRAMPLAEAAARAVGELRHPDAEAEITWSARGRCVPRVRLGLPAPAVDAGAATMVRLVVGRPGLLDTLGWDAVAESPAPGPGQVAIQVHAAGLNFRDVMWAMGLLPDEALLDGFAGPTIGLECAGIVSAVGADVTAFAPGDRVMAFAPASMGSQTVTAAHAVMRMPDHMAFAEAATVPVAFLTVAYSLGHLAQLQPGERVLVHGGAGGVGLAAIQYARLKGATVFATAGSQAKRAMLRRLGVDAVLDSRSLGFADEVMRLTGGTGVDVVLNSVSGEAMELSLGLMRPFGRFLELGKRDFYGNTAVGLRPFRQNISYFGVDADQLPLRRPVLAASLFAEVAGLMQDGALRPLPHRVFDASDASEAFRLMQASGHIGKIVLQLGQGAAAPVSRKAPVAAPKLPVQADRTYAVTGGANGFGLAAAGWLADQGVRHLALLSRRGAETDGLQAALEALRATGVQAEAFQCDVADEVALAGALEAIRATMPSLGGVIHAAVAMDDAILSALDESRFAKALRPKLDGVEALDRLTRTDPIGLFVVFSSVTTVLGNPGQANYVAANAAAEAVVERRHREGLPGLAVQWGPIGDVGYLAREAGVAKLLSRRLGGQFATATEALDMLPVLLAAGAPVVGMADVRWGTLAASLPLLRSSLFEELHGGIAEPAAEVDVRELLENSTPEVAQEKLSALLSEEVARIMKTSQASIEVHRPLAELGMDSLMAVELRLAVEQRFGLSIPVLALSDGASLWALAGRMARSIGVKDTPEEPNKAAELAERINRFEPGADAQPVEHSFAAAAAVMP